MVYLGVIGAGQCDEQTASAAYGVGREAALGGAILVCGGRGGVMEAACRGCKDSGGVSLGILPGLDRREANPYVSYVLTTGMSAMRNFLVVRCSDVLIALPGKYGTLSEMAIALKEGKKVFALFPSLLQPVGKQSREQRYELPPRRDPRLEQFLPWPDLEVVFSPQEAVKKALSSCGPA